MSVQSDRKPMRAHPEPPPWLLPEKLLGTPQGDDLTHDLDALASILGPDLESIYAYGSVVSGCFRPPLSDIDLIVVTRQPCSEETAERIGRHAEKRRPPIDATFVTSEQLHADILPTPVDLLSKPFPGMEAVRKPEGSLSFLLDRQDAYENGMAILGRPLAESIRSVPWNLIEQSLDRLSPHIVPNFKHPTLMLCRVVCTLSRRRMCSKEGAGLWALENLPSRWGNLIRADLDAYAKGRKNARPNPKALDAFEAFCLSSINRTSSR